MKLRTRLRTIMISGGALFLLSAGAIVQDGLTDEIGPADVAVVLGSQVKEDGQPSQRLQARLDRTLELYQQGWFDHIIVSGGTGKTGFNEAVVMRDYLAERGVPREHILADGSGNNTYLTAQHSTQLMREHDWQSAMVISQYYHIPRAKLVLRRAGVKTLYSGQSNFFELRDLYAIAREIVAYAVYLVRYR